MEDHVRPVRFNYLDNGSRIAEVCFHKNHAVLHRRQVGIRSRTTGTLDPKYLSAIAGKQLSEIRTVLPADTRDQCARATHPAIVPSRTPLTRVKGAFTCLLPSHPTPLSAMMSCIQVPPEARSCEVA